MKDFAARFGSPIPAPRPRGTRLLEAYSPKLDRRVRFFDHLAFSQWIRLEADPGVSNFCERPARVDRRPDACLIDFWVQRAGAEKFLLLESRYDLPVPEVEGLAVDVVPLAELAAARTWISNWIRMLPVINATRSLVPKSLIRALLGRVVEPQPLARLERDLSVGDPTLVRGAIFDLLRKGQLGAPSLRDQPLSLHLTLEPAP
jgi:hypothetical protein